MTKKERTHLTSQLNAIIDLLNAAISPISPKERICIICEQIKAIRGIVDGLEGGGVDG